MSLKLNETDVIQRALISNYGDVEPLVEYLKMDESSLFKTKDKTREDAEQIIACLRKMGSNDLATIWRGEGVPYQEVVFDVASKLKVPDVNKYDSAEGIERKIILKIFQDAFDQMSESEQKEFLKELNISSSDIPLGAMGTMVAQFILKQYGGFAVYKMAVIVAHYVAKALLGRALSFGGYIAVTRTVSAALGPIGWILSGAWLAIDLMGPAYRKTVPAVVHMAALRQIVSKRVNIGLVGDGSAGKDSMLKAVFEVDTHNVSPIAGSTTDVKEYEYKDTGAVTLINYPGFNDVSDEVNKLVMDRLHHTDLMLLVIDITRGLSQTDLDILDAVQALNRPVLICLNKIDLLREEDKEPVLKAAHERLGKYNFPMLETSFNPDPRLTDGNPMGANLVIDWLIKELDELGKDSSVFK